ncbi:hypothetical protein OAG24_00155 [bacterium]|nr:hypothetical protein [bacterium]
MNASYDEITNSKIKSSDAASALRTKVNSNQKPYSKAVIRLNNQLVDCFENSVLEVRSDDGGCIPSASVWSWWMIFHEGFLIEKYISYSSENLILMPPEDDVQVWKTIFEKSTVEELFELGISNVSYGWTVIQDKIRFWCSEQKWNNVFSKSKDPNDWIDTASAHKDLFDGKLLPFWTIEELSDISEKVSSIILCEVKPGSKLKVYIFKNERPYTRSALTCYNKLLANFKAEVLDQKYRDVVDLNNQKRWDLWLIYYEQYLSEKQIIYSSDCDTELLSEDHIKQWCEIFDIEFTPVLSDYILKNEKSYLRSELTQYNKLLKRFKNKFGSEIKAESKVSFDTQAGGDTLVENLDNLKIENNKWDSWLNYFEKCISEKQVGKSLIKPLSEDHVKQWCKIFEKSSVEEIYKYGVPAVSYGWALIQLYLRMWCAKTKWDKVFSVRKTFDEWFEASNTTQKDLFDGRELPFWTFEQFQDIKEKIGTIILTQINPD